MLTIQQIAHALDGDALGNYALISGPNHSKNDRSLCVFIDPNNQDGFRVHSYANDDWRHCRDYIKSRLGLSNQRNITKHNIVHFENLTKPDIAKPPDKLEKRKKALSIWQASKPLKHTIAERYLEKRIGGKALIDCVYEADQIRFNPTQKLKDQGGCSGALVARMIEPKTSKFVGIQRIFLNSNAEKIEKRMFGGSGVVAVTGIVEGCGLALGEGLENTIAAMTRYYWTPIYAAMTAGNMGAFPVLNAIDAITIFADNDKNDVGVNAAIECAKRYKSAGSETYIFKPKLEDFAKLQERSQ